MNKEEQEIRLDQTKKVFEVLADAIKNGSISYRNLIYDKLGFNGYYADLIDGLTITNAIVDLEEKDKVIDEVKNYCKSKSKFNCFGDSLTEKVLNTYVNATKKDILEILERGKNGLDS